MIDVAALARRIADGDTEAENALVEALRPGLLTVLRHGRHPRTSDAEDIAHDALGVILARLRAGSLLEPQKIFAFAAQTARNLAINAGRKSRRQRTISNTDLLARVPVESPDELNALAEQEVARAVLRLLDELPQQRDRLILVRFYVDNQTKASICAELGLTNLHFNRVLARARDRFRRLLETHAAGLGLRMLGLVTLFTLPEEIRSWVRYLLH